MWVGLSQAEPRPNPLSQRSLANRGRHWTQACYHLPHRVPCVPCISQGPIIDIALSLSPSLIIIRNSYICSTAALAKGSILSLISLTYLNSQDTFT